MKILFLDDDANRHVTFRAVVAGKHEGPEYLYATTVEEAIEILDNNLIDIAFLDHDLGGRIYVSETEGTGYEVALHIADMEKSLRPKSIIVHSVNSAGAYRMIGCLQDAVDNVIYIPFFNIQQVSWRQT